jgi:dihydrofolate synthase/folylpolyglutamate synthase
MADSTPMPSSVNDDDPKEQRRNAAADYLLGRVNYERISDVPYTSRRFKMERMEELLRRVGSPHRGMRAVHVAGTKGKGSTATMIATVLTDAGYRTGLFTSPHFERIEERFVVDGVPCSANELVNLVEMVKPAVEAMDREASLQVDPVEHRPTYFEVVTAVAFLHFARSAVDLAVLEVGLGGRLDSTNVCEPLVSVITSISLDHMAQLGTTVEEIAAEKAGIIKPNTPVVSGVFEPGPRDVIREAARDLGCRLTEAGTDFTTVETGLGGDDASAIFDFRQADGGELCGLRVVLPGEHQRANAALALAVISELRRVGYNLPDAAIRSGLARASCPARVEILPRSPTIVLDVAHNGASMEALVKTLQERFRDRRRWVIFAAGKDKDLGGMLEVLLPAFDQVVFTRYLENPRAVSPEELAEMARGLTGQTYAKFSTPAESWSWAIDRAAPDDLICVTGSFFIVAEIRRLLPRDAR